MLVLRIMKTKLYLKRRLAGVNGPFPDPDKSRQKFHHSLKEHLKISNIPKFRCEML